MHVKLQILKCLIFVMKKKIKQALAWDREFTPILYSIIY